MTSRASPAVGATSATRRAPWLWIRSLTYSAPVRVLPNPRPANNSQTRQLPGGGLCSSRAQYFQPRASISRCCSLRLRRNFWRCGAGSEASQFTIELILGRLEFDGVTACESSVLLNAGLFPAHPRLGEEHRERRPGALVFEALRFWPLGQDRIDDERADLDLDLGLADIELGAEVPE